MSEIDQKCDSLLCSELNFEATLKEDNLLNGVAALISKREHEKMCHFQGLKNEDASLRAELPCIDKKHGNNFMSKYVGKRYEGNAHSTCFKKQTIECFLVDNRTHSKTICNDNSIAVSKSDYQKKGISVSPDVPKISPNIYKSIDDSQSKEKGIQKVEKKILKRQHRSNFFFPMALLGQLR